ncbi:MAG: hypothetical protein BRC40_15075 [Cyanobacteria bacterium QH_8_48_120]|jgi:hypothetical protein|nr:MAG: hypothetical protein BRC40_15075 [Cyanobacteria bacterium QH_8_48_120]
MSVNLEHKQANLAEIEHSTRASVIAGTSEGLWLGGSQQHIELEGYQVTSLAPSPDGLWAVVNRDSVWHRNPDGEWHMVTSSSDLQLKCILPLEETVLAGTSEAHLVRVADGSIEYIDGFERAEGRNNWYTPWGGPPDVRSLAVGHSGELYANVHVGGILRSDDQGGSWQQTIDIDSDVHQVRTIPGRPGFVLAATAEGLATSTDGGNSWRFDRAHLHGSYARAVAVSRETVLITASLGPHAGKAAVYRRPLDQPGSFQKCERGLPEWFSDNINTGCLATSNNWAAFGTSEGEIFVSDDTGLTWKQLASDLAPIRCLSIV